MTSRPPKNSDLKQHTSFLTESSNLVMSAPIKLRLCVSVPFLYQDRLRILVAYNCVMGCYKKITKVT